MLTIQNSINLVQLNTLHLNSIANHYIQLTTLEQIGDIATIINNYPRYFVLGGGSNLILPENYDGLVIHNQLKGITFDRDNAGYKLVTAAAGEIWDDFVANCLENQAYGLENLSLIPGTVGASPIQNIGAYGVEVKDFIDSVTVYDFNLRQLTKLSNAECQFSYRNSYLKNKPQYLVVNVTFKLPTTAKLMISYGDIAKQMAAIDNPTAHDLRACIINTRRSKLPDPAEIGNAGSFFHNPIIAAVQAQELKQRFPNLPIYPTANAEQVKVSAGWLIDNLGLKGARSGNIGVYPKQALVLVNYANANKDELLAFAKEIQAQIYGHYQIQLNIEPIIL
ncbi:MAG TPA: UDP-N-acetylmuramate dehydrogenase [Burkholderiales bacterium]|jgi:UDP-N-acetylmuramate dehydrogenase|nr:UDP-N-acetylmuramate dehydrogenase [Burkholderiales bacterium]